MQWIKNSMKAFSSFPKHRAASLINKVRNFSTKPKQLKFYVGATGIAGCGLGLLVLYAGEDNSSKKKKLVILGSGWGAVSLIKSLNPGEFEVSVVSPDNYFLFTPLLPSVTVGTVEGRSIIEPIRKILARKHKHSAKFYEAQCTNVDIEGNKVVCKDLSDILGHKQEFWLDYDYLVLAVGAQTATYNIKGIEEHTHYLKNMQQAQKIRKHVMDSFETAAIPGQPDHEVRRLLNFVVVGGGPTGVEFAAELRDFVTEDLRKIFPDEMIDKSTITLIDGLNKILNSYSDEISRYTENKFKREGINVVTNTFVAGVEEKMIYLKDAKTREVRSMDYGMCVWAAGIAPRELTKQLMKEIPGQTNRMALITDPFMKVRNTRNIFAVGDCCTVQTEKLADFLSVLLNENGIDEKGTMNLEQFNDVMTSAKKRYPQLCSHFKQMEKLLVGSNRDSQQNISSEDFTRLAEEADEKQTFLPPTAQVAAQEGKYLGKLLNKHKDDIANQRMRDVNPFQYNHLGSFAYVGDNRAVLELPFLGAFKGWSAMWLWRGAYASECVSLRMRVLVLFDWIKSFMFGRDTSRI